MRRKTPPTPCKKLGLIFDFFMVVWFSFFLNTTLSRGRISPHLKI